MKLKVIAAALLNVSVMAFVLAQGDLNISGSHLRYTKPYHPTNAPPVSLTASYNLLLTKLGKATNDFYCVSASCLATNIPGLPGWTFGFANTNGEVVYVKVIFDGELRMDGSSARLLGNPPIGGIR